MAEADHQAHPKRRWPTGTKVFIAFGLTAWLGLATYNFIHVGCRSRQSEAKTTLKVMHRDIKAFVAREGRPPSHLTDLPPLRSYRKPYYRFELSPPGAAGVARAVGIRDHYQGDTWIIHDDGRLEVTVNRCR
jgi:hypothetical protein